MAWYNFSNLTEGQGILNLMVYANEVSNNWYGNLVLMGLFMVLFIVFKQYETKRAFVASSFITVIVAILFKIMGLTGELPIIIGMVFVAVGIISMFLE